MIVEFIWKIYIKLLIGFRAIGLISSNREPKNRFLLSSAVSLAANAVCETNVSLKNTNETMLSLEMRVDPSNRYAGTDSNHLKLQWLNAICGER